MKQYQPSSPNERSHKGRDLTDDYAAAESPPEAAFDDLARLAAQVCGVPYAIISLMGKDRLWIKSQVGFTARDASLENAFTTHAVQESEILVVNDALNDRRFAKNPKVSGPPHVRFYAGAVLRNTEGAALGALGVFDKLPRELNAEQRDALIILARQVSAQLELRRLKHQSAPSAHGSGLQFALQEDAAVLETLARVGADLTAELDLDRLLQKITDAATELTGAKFGALFHNEKKSDGDVYQLYNLSGASRESFANFPAPRKTAVFGPTFRGEGIVRSADIVRDSRYGKNAPHTGLPQGHLPVRSYLAVPVTSRTGDVIGGLLFGHPEPNVFTDRAERLATGIAAQAAIAIDNARLYKLTTDHQARLQQEVEERTRELAESNQRLQQEIEERKQAEAALRQAQKMEAIGQLTGGVAHDFNNLLQVIGANLQLLEHQLEIDDPATKRRLSAAGNAVQRGAKLSSQLLAFARRQPLEPKPVDLGRRLQDMDDLLRRTLGAEILLEVSVERRLWNTFVDPVQVENAILNLALNARDAMPGGGRLSISASNRRLDEQYCSQQKDVAPGEYVMVDISDTGCGMAPELVERVFEPFFTTKEEGRGTGLGLSQVYGFVKQSNGHISIYSEEHEGTSVKLYLPRALQEEEAEPARPPAQIEGGDETILVAEDDPEVRETAVDSLRELGYHVLKAVDGQSALAIIESGIPVDLLFSDVVMPGPLKAPDLARQARRAQPDIAVLFTSGYTQNAIVHEGRLDPGVELLSKPYRREQLAVKVRHVLRNREQRLAARKAHGSGENASRSAHKDAAGTSRSLRVLMVEDDREVLELMSALMEDLGHDVVTCTHAEAALAALRREQFHVLFTDVGLPDISGVELARQALERQQTLRVIFASGYGNNIDADDLPDDQVHILPKPYGVKDVERALSRDADRLATTAQDGRE